MFLMGSRNVITCEPFVVCQISLRCLANVRCRVFPDSFMSQVNEHSGKRAYAPCKHR
jgi:hypothetical protein